jgi:hypothetical protein
MAMGTSIGRFGAVVALGLWVVACSGSSKSGDKVTPDRVCEPGTKSCDGQNVKVCSDDGTERTIEQTCSPSQTCADGACAETACVPNTKFCQGGDVWKCDSTGSGSLLSQACGKAQFCREAEDSAKCSDEACTPGAAMCDGSVATTCLDDGSGPAMGGTDCTETKQACIDGACKDTACVAGSKLCMNEDVYLCGQNGKDLSLLADCQAGTVCDGDKQACVAKICDVGSTGCDGNTAVNCNAFGSGWEPVGTDCSTSNQVCVAGACKKQTCTASGRFCQGGDVYECDQFGVKSDLYSPCYGLQYCIESGSYASCAQGCTPNQIMCSGNSALVCNADGSWPQESTDCGASKFCEEGTGCKATVCDAGTIFCKDGDVYGCDWRGSRADLYQQCPTDTTCKILDGNYSCIPLPCSPGETACLGNKIGTCAADGQTLSVVTSDCTATTSLCGPDNKCTKSAIDVLGDDEDSYTEYSGNFFGDIVQVNSARKLTEMQMDLNLRSPRELRWVVFEETSPYTYTAKQDWLVSSQTGDGFFSSGAISYSLKTGKTYLFGVTITGGNTSTSYVDTAPFAVNASLGAVLGRVDTGYSSVINVYPDSSSVYHMKLTTTP